MKTFLTVLFIITSQIVLLAQSNMDKGDSFFKKRHSHIGNGKASSEEINKAISYYLKAEDSPKKYVSLLQSYEFKGSWTNLSDEEAKESYHKGVLLGKKIKDQYPNNAGIWYWYIANLSRWGDQLPITKAAEEGILNEVKEVAEKIIKLEPSYQEAGALRLLGGIHLKAPEIPFILSWPSEEKAKELLNRAYDIAPQNAANQYYYNLMLLNEARRTEAKTGLEALIKMKARQEFLLADRKFINKGKELYAEEFD